MELRLNVHSIVDVITNSSTTIFTWAGNSAIKSTKELINSILKLSDIDKRAEDLFTFNLEYTRYAKELIAEKILEMEDFKKRIDAFEKTFPNGWRDLKWSEEKAKLHDKLNAFVIELFYGLPTEEQEEIVVNCYDFPLEQTVIIKAKDEKQTEAIDILVAFNSIFEQEAV